MKPLIWEYKTEEIRHYKKIHITEIWLLKLPFSGLRVEKGGMYRLHNQLYWALGYSEEKAFDSLEEAKSYIVSTLEDIIRRTVDAIGMEFSARPMPPANKGGLYGDTAKAWKIIDGLADIEIRVSDLRRLMGGEIGTTEKYGGILKRLCSKGLIVRTWPGVYRKVLK